MSTSPDSASSTSPTAARESQIVLGIDPDPARLWPDPREAERSGDEASGRGSGVPRERLAVALAGTADAAHGPSPAPAAAEAAAAVLGHCRALIDGAGPACVAVKPQLACFERLGSAGWLALEATCAHARAAGLLVLADGKRGDVPVTALAYAQGLVGSTPSPFGAVPGLDVDALTANPLMGRDALVPLVEGARAAGAGVFLLVRTSNPGAADVLDLPLATGEPLWERLAAIAGELGEAGEQGLADVGAVTGATVPEHLARMRELMPRTPFLLPGVGAQGGDIHALAPAFAPGRAAGLVTASRSIANAYEQHGGTPGNAARSEAERLREIAWDLA
jgi:orotidine-5'-phosphate decarboxylase